MVSCCRATNRVPAGGRAMLAAFLFCLPAGYACAASANLLTNGDFRQWADGRPSGWVVGLGAQDQPGDTGAASTITWIADGPPGNAALRLEGNAQTVRWLAVSQGPLAVAPGDVLCLSGWMRTNHVQLDGHRFSNCYLGLSLFDAKGKRLSLQTCPSGSGTSPWTAEQISVLVPPEGRSASVTLFLSMSGSADFADLRLTRVAALTRDTSLSEAEGWRADLEYLSEALPWLHVDPFRHLAREDFQTRMSELIEQVGRQSYWENTMALLRIIAALGDAHTTVAPDGKRQIRLPITFYRFSDGLFVTAVGSSCASLLQGRVVRIGDYDVNTVWEKLSPYVSHQTDSWLDQTIPAWLSLPPMLQGAGLLASESALPLTVVGPDERPWQVLVEPQAGPVFLTPAPPEDQRPLYLRGTDLYRYEYLEETRTLYVSYRQCAEDPNRPMSKFTADVLQVVDSRPVDRFVFDVRLNSGGNSSLAGPLIEGIARKVQEKKIGRTYVITGRATFSSAILNACAFQQATGALVAGEPLGDKPNHLGEIRALLLPNTGLTVYYSTSRFLQTLPGDPPTLPLDLPVSLSAQDYFSGRDLVLEAILHDRR
jgi:hypothetical protein